MVVCVPARLKYFTPEFMEQFNEEHKQHFPESGASRGGWPDSGDGRYSKKLDYKDWVDFNNKMRVHQNFVEALPLIITTLLLASLAFPLVTCVIDYINMVARLVFTVMYVKFGANSRIIGAVAGGLPIYLLSLATLVTFCIRAGQAAI